LRALLAESPSNLNALESAKGPEAKVLQVELVFFSSHLKFQPPPESKQMINPYVVDILFYYSTEQNFSLPIILS